MSLKTALDELPTTNLRIVVSLTLATLFVLVMLGALVFKIDPPNDVVNTVALFILALLTADVVQFTAKRMTYKKGETTEPVQQ